MMTTQTSLLLFPALLVLAAGCGDSGGGGEQLCYDTCVKSLECNDLGDMRSVCRETCQSGESEVTMTCDNDAERVAHVRDCQDLPCGEFEACLDSAPDCEGGETTDGGTTLRDGGSGGPSMTVLDACERFSTCTCEVTPGCSEPTIDCTNGGPYGPLDMCANFDEIESHLAGCLEEPTCTDYLDCVDMQPECSF